MADMGALRTVDVLGSQLATAEGGLISSPPGQRVPCQPERWALSTLGLEYAPLREDAQ